MASGFELGKNRIEALSDGVFAIAMTILVLAFKSPNLPHDATNVMLISELSKLWPTIVSYAIAFVSLGVYWVLHHLVYSAFRAADRVLLWLSILFFLFVSLLPFSVQLMGDFPRAYIGAVLFGANLAVVGWLLLFQWRYGLSRENLVADHTTNAYRESVGARIALAPLVSTITTLICFWSVGTSLAIYTLVLPIYFLPSSHERDLKPEAMSRFAIVRKALTVVAIGGFIYAWYLFRPELLFINSRVSEAKESQSQTVLSGKFVGLAHATKGQAMIERSGDKMYLRFTDFSTSNGPDVHVYLVAAPDSSSDDVVRHAGFINLGKMKGSEGDQNYDLPAGVDLATYRSVSLWCQRFNVNFASVALK